MVESPYPITGLLLAGGASRRMGRPKAGLDVGGRTLIDRALAPLRAICQEVILITRHPSDWLEYPERIVRDMVPGQGPLGGLEAGLFFARHPWTLVLACDLPFVRAGVLELIARRALAIPGQRSPRAVVPRTELGWQPLFAAYSVACLPAVREILAAGGRRVDDLMRHGVGWEPLPEQEIRAIDPDLSSFINLNTPDDLALARARLDTETPDD